MHLPVVGLMQVNLFSVQAPTAVKFLLVLTLTLALGLASYQAMVRHTIIGIWLHGRRDRARPTSLALPQFHARQVARAPSETRIPRSPSPRS